MSEEPEVTQADRDAAADYVSHGGEVETVYHKGIRTGHYDHPLAYAFARHRQRVEDGFANWLQGIADHTDNSVEYDLLRSLICSIEEGEHRDEPVSALPVTEPTSGELPPF